MLVKLAFNATRNSRIKSKNAKIPVTETGNLHTQVHKYTSNTTHKQSEQTENNQNCKTLGLFILLSAEIWITVMKNDTKC